MATRYLRKDSLDKFYTNPDIAKRLISKIDISKFASIIEPSAGNGSFSRQIPNCFAMDIDPQADWIHKQDFLEWNHCGNVKSSDILCIGNPPFGKQGNLALRFLAKAMEIADTVAFILPPSFTKASMINRIPAYFHLHSTEKLEKDSFLFEGKPYDVPAVFQIWVKKDVKREKIVAQDPVGFSYTTKDKANLAVRRVGFYAGRAYKELDKSVQSHYFLKVDEDKLEKVFEVLNSHPWEHGNTVGPRSVSKLELNEVISQLT
jgi:hypothetical protein